MGLKFIKLNLAQLEEIGDLVGFPIKEHEVVKTEDGKTETRWIPESVMASYIANRYRPTGEKRMSHAAPEWIQGATEGGLLILDDWTRADLRFVQAIMELIDRQEYISWKLPKDWHVILTSNPDNGDYLVNSIDTAQRTRFITANLKFDIDCWAKWAESVEIDSRCINFLIMHPELVTENINARGITTFFNSISSFEKFEDSLPMIQMIGEGSVGPEFSTTFSMFIANKLDKIISPKDIIENSSWEYVKGVLRSTFGEGDSYRADLASLLATRIVNYTVNYSQKHAVTPEILQRLTDLTLDETLFTNDLKYFMIRNIVNSNKVKFQKLMLNPEIVKMVVK
jgi:hypothetical protein